MSTTPEAVAVASIPNPLLTALQSKNDLLLASATARIGEGFYILPLDPISKRPMSTVLNPQGHPYSKGHNGIHGWYSASNGAAREYLDNTGVPRVTTPALKAWHDALKISVDAANIAIALELSGLTVLDLDEGLSDAQELLLFCSDFHIPISRAIRSGRRTSFGAHLYFNGIMPSGHFSIAWRGKTITGEVKSVGCYVVGEGSFHKSGEQYSRLWDIPIVETPTQLFTELLEKYKPSSTGDAPVAQAPVKFDGASITQERFEECLEANKQEVTYDCYNPLKNRHEYTRTNGCPWDETAQAEDRELHTGENNPSDFAIYFGEDGFKVHCVHESCKADWAVPNNGWQSYKKLMEKVNGTLVPFSPKKTKVFVGKNKNGVLPNAPCEGEVMSNPTSLNLNTTPSAPESEYPTFPEDAKFSGWMGALRNAITEGMAVPIPAQFLDANMRVIVGMLLDGHVAIEGEATMHTRVWNFNIAKMNGGKGLSYSRIAGEKVWDTDSDLNGVLRPLFAHDMCGGNGNVLVVEGLSSSEAAVSQLSNMERTLLRFDELDTLFQKDTRQGSTMLSSFRTLYEEGKLSNRTIRRGVEEVYTRAGFSGDITPAAFERASSSANLRNDGTLRRITLHESGVIAQGDIIARTPEQVATIIKYQGMMKARLTELSTFGSKDVKSKGTAPMKLSYSDGAKTLLGAFNEELKAIPQEEAEFAAGIYDYVKKDAIIRAVMSDDYPIISEDTMKASISWGRYQLNLRRAIWTDPVNGAEESMEHRIVKGFKAYPLGTTKGKVYDHIHGERGGGAGVFLRAWENLVRIGKLYSDDGKRFHLKGAL